MKIPLGSVVKDRVTGFIGIAENRATFMYGCDRYCVQPRVDESGKFVHLRTFSYRSLAFHRPTKQVFLYFLFALVQLVKMGQLVDDPIRGMSGTVTGRSVYLNGCSRVLVEPKQKGNKEILAWWVDEKQVIGKKTFLGEQKVPVSPDLNRKTGGPAPSSSKC